VSFSLLHKLVAYLISGLGLWALSLGTELTGFALSLFALGYVASFFAEGKVLTIPRYATSWTVAVVLYLFYQLFRAATEELTLALAMEFAAFLQISRLFNRRTAADYQQIAVLAFLHLVAATVLSTSLIYAALFAGFLIVTPWMLALSNLRREIESNYSQSAEPDEKALAAIRRVLASRRVVGPRFLLGTAALAVPLFAMTLAIFVLVPRVGKGFFTFQRGRAQRVAGFGNLVELGGFGVIRDDPTVVLRITPLPRTAKRPERASFRLRGTSFDRYDGRRWTRTPSNSLLYPQGLSHYRIRRSPDRRNDRKMRIVLNRLDENVIFLPEGSVALELPVRYEDGQRISPRLFLSAGLDFRYVEEESLGLVYSTYSDPAAGAVGWPALEIDQQLDYLQMPPGHERVRELAERVTAGADNDVEKINRVLKFLSETGGYTYSLDQPYVGGRPPLEAFLFDAKRGHCEYFSSAMAIMLRSLGIPTRNVTGFVGGRYNPYGDYYALRQGDAHSWVEAYLPDRGWLTLDPTPPGRGALGIAEDLFADLRAVIDALRTRWITSVVAYDLRTQIGMARKLMRFMDSFRGDRGLSPVRDRTTSIRDRLPSGRTLLAWIAGLVALIGIGIVVRKYWRPARARDRQPMTRHAAEAVKLYRELERALGRRGRPRPPSTTPVEHAQRLKQEGFPLADGVQEVTGRYMEVRYGNRSLPAEELSRLRSIVSAVRSDRAAPPPPGTA
jgi:transglutaminase-like putative cysteine protease